MNDLTISNPSTTFRAKAADLMIDAAKMSLHQLVDEFQRLAEEIEKNTVQEDNGYRRLNEVGELANREQRMINAAARARFGISFDTYDRNIGSSEDSW